MNLNTLNSCRFKKLLNFYEQGILIHFYFYKSNFPEILLQLNTFTLSLGYLTLKIKNFYKE